MTPSCWATIRVLAAAATVLNICPSPAAYLLPLKPSKTWTLTYLISQNKMMRSNPGNAHIANLMGGKSLSTTNLSMYIIITRTKTVEIDQKQTKIIICS